MDRTRSTIAALVCGPLLVVVACGSGDDSGSDLVVSPTTEPAATTAPTTVPAPAATAPAPDPTIPSATAAAVDAATWRAEVAPATMLSRRPRITRTP